MRLKSLHYLFSKKPKIGSRLIVWASNKLSGVQGSPAHTAVLINERFVFESTFKHNVSIMSYEKWKQQNIEVGKLKCIKERDYSEIKDLFREIEGLKYDWFGILYFAWRILLTITLKRDMPSKNKWQSNGAYFCCEVVARLTEQDYQMKTPGQVMNDLKEILK